MKNTFPRSSLFVALLLCAALGMMAFSPLQAPPPNAGDPLTLPDFVPVLLAAGLGWLITQGLKSAGKVYPWFPNLEKEAAATAAAIVTTIILVGNAALALVPAEWQTPIVLLFGTIGSILSAYGIYDTVKGFQNKADSKSIDGG